jgi:hypothetical protein
MTIKGAPARYDGKWLKIPYDGPELTVIEIGLANGTWHAAYRDWDDDGTRVVQIRAGPAQAEGLIRVRAGGVLRSEHAGVRRRRQRPA